MFNFCVFCCTVCLQPFDFDPNEKNKHKFMVQSLIAPEGEFNAEQLVREMQHTKKFFTLKYEITPLISKRFF